MDQAKQTPWYEGAVIYQIYPRSFQDSSGNGIGDLQGITNRLDYLAADRGLGVDAIWLSPFYPSPMADFGYDVSNYCDVDPIFGTLADFDELVRQAQQRNIKVLVDFVPNHTSEQHEWFKESRSSTNNPKRDWYIWRDPAPNGGPPNNWLSVFGGSAWEWDEKTGQFYLHSFLRQQPDLNWDNPEVSEAMTAAMRFWLDRGVDGFRVDATDHIGKHKDLPDEPLSDEIIRTGDPYDILEHIYTHNAGSYHLHMHHIAEVLASYPDKIAIFETWMKGQRKTQLLLDFYKQMAQPNAMPFNFELMDTPWEASAIQQRIDTFQSGLGADHTPVYVLSNHDRPRFPARIGRDACRSAALLELTLPGIALVYYGDEIGMEDISVPRDKIQDPFGKRHPQFSRDGARSPMQWNNAAYAGFSTVEPWLPVHDDYSNRNVDQQLQDGSSLLRFYQQLIQLRHQEPALRVGEYRSVAHEVDGMVVFDRLHQAKNCRIFINFTDREITIDQHILDDTELILSTHENQEAGRLQPHQAVIRSF